MATIDVIMPQMGESIAEGTLSRWIKKVGEAVKRDEPIFEISTDKVDAEIPAPAAGVLSEILVQEGQTVAVQTVVARIDTEAAAGAAKAAPSRGEGPAASAPAPAASAPAPEPRGGARRSSSTEGRACAAAGLRDAGSRRPSRRGEVPRRPCRREQRRGGDRRGAAAPPLHAAGAQDGRRARPRSERDSGHRARGAGHQERRARLHRQRRRRPAWRRCAAPGRTGSRAGRRRGAAAPRSGPRCRGRALGGRPGRALEPDPQAHRRAHGDVAAGLAPREHDLRDRLHPRGPAPRAGRSRSTPSAA